MPVTIEQIGTQVSDLAKRVEELAETANKQISRVHVGDSSLSYFEVDPNESRMKGLKFSGRMGRRNQLPEGYRPGVVFKSYSDYLREGVRAYHPDKGGSESRKSEFHTRYKSVWKSVQGMSEGTNSDGGYLVLPEFAPDIYDRAWQNDLHSLCDQYTVRGNGMRFPRNAETSRANGSRAGGIQAYWVNEGEAGTASKPKLARTELELKKLVVIVYLTNELIDDNSYAIEQWVRKKVGDEFNFMLTDSVMNGKGGGMPLGFLNSGATIEVAKEGSQGADTILAENIVNMYSRRLANANPQGWRWVMHQSVAAQLMRMYIATGSAVGGLVYVPPAGFSEKPYATMLGMPIIECETCPTLGDRGDISLVNLGEYVTITKGGITEVTSTEVEFLTDQLAIKFTMRFDGRPYDDQPITPYAAGDTTPPTQSAFITLAART